MTEQKNENQPQVKMADYEICEHKKEIGAISIFDLQLEDLVFEKMFIMFEIIDKAQRNLDSAELQKQAKKDKLLLETDFSEVLGKARTNKEEREAYMQNELKVFDKTIEKCQKKLDFYKNKIIIINDLISTKKIMLKLEANIREE